MDKELYNALKNKYEVSYTRARVQSQVWLDRPTIIPEHMNAVKNLIKQFKQFLIFKSD